MIEESAPARSHFVEESSPAPSPHPGASQVVVVIPAYQPAPTLPMLVGELAASPTVAAVVVVNDGSSPHYRSIFTAVSRLHRATVLSHAVNLG